MTSNTERAASAGSATQPPSCIPVADEIFAAEMSYDLVVVATSELEPCALAQSAIAAGLPLVVDKPLATTADEAQRLVDHAKARAAAHRLSEPALGLRLPHAAASLLDNGDLGTSAVSNPASSAGARPSRVGLNQVTRPKAVASSLDLGSHLVDQALVLFGPVTRVYATLDRRRPGVAVEDDACLALTHASGVRSTLWVSAVVADLGPAAAGPRLEAPTSWTASTARRIPCAPARIRRSPRGRSRRGPMGPSRHRG